MSTPLDDLGLAQEQLGRAIDQARAGEDRQLAQQVRDHGEQVIRLLNGLQRLTRIHDPKNAAFDQPVHELASSLRQLYDLLGDIRVICVEGQVYVNDIRIRLDERQTSAAELSAELARHGAGGLTFHEPLVDAQIRALTFLLAGPAPAEHPRRVLAHALGELGLGMVEPTGFFRLRLSGEKSEAATDDNLVRALHKAGAAATDAWAQVAAGRLPNTIPLRRVVTEIVDASAELDVIADEALLPDDATGAYARHCRRVCALAIVLGREVGLPAANIADLGVAAMFHDAGYATRSGGHPPDRGGHMLATLRVLLRQRGFHTAKLRRQLAAAEHHRDHADHPSLYGRILRICDDFDTFTRLRPDGRRESPSIALRRMAAAAGTAYDPVLLALFVNRVGRYPAGTLLRLDDGRIAMSVSGARDEARWALPIVRVVREVDGSPSLVDLEIDLAVMGAIVEEVEPSELEGAAPGA